MKQIKLLITDDHQMLRESMAMLFSKDERFNVIGQCSNGEQAVSMARAYQPDIMLMDINMPVLNGFDASELIAKESPLVKILAVSMNAGTGIVKKIMKGGVMGYVTKNSTSDELKKAVIEINENRKYICSEIKNQLSAEMLESALLNTTPKEPSKRELQILCKVAEGFTSIEIGQQLDLSVKTVEAHRYNIKKKLKLNNVSAIICYLRDSYISN
jgi:DNA-binding NarL/FixJ family response regulator